MSTHFWRSRLISAIGVATLKTICARRIMTLTRHSLLGIMPEAIIRVVLNSNFTPNAAEAAVLLCGILIGQLPIPV